MLKIRFIWFFEGVKLKIYHLYDEHFPVSKGKGSVSTIVYYLAKTASRKGHDVTILERRWRGLSREETKDGIKFKRFDLSIGSDKPGREIPYQEIQTASGFLRLLADRFQFAVKLKEYLKNLDFQILHVHLPFTSNILVHLDTEIREKMVYTAHVGEEVKRFNLDSEVSKPFPLNIFSPDLHLMSRVAKGIVLNHRIKLKLREKGLNNVEVVPNGIDTDEFPVDSKEAEIVTKKYGLTKNLTGLFVGTITPQKGLKVLLKAINQIDRDDILFLLTGDKSIDKDYYEKLVSFVQEKSLENQVKFTGYIPYQDLRALYSSSDFFILPSREEGFPMVLTEAMASGKPLIGSNIGGISMQIKNGWNGYLFEPNNSKELALKIENIAKNPKKIEKMGKNSRRMAEKKFSWNKITDKYLEIYNPLVEKTN